MRQEKVQLEETLEKEQEYQVNKLMRKIDKLEAETESKQNTLDQLRREKVELENSLEQEQEALVNRLWKKMDKLEAEKRLFIYQLRRNLVKFWSMYFFYLEFCFFISVKPIFSNLSRFDLRLYRNTTYVYVHTCVCVSHTLVYDKSEIGCSKQ